MKKQIKLFFAWFNYKLSWFTHHNKPDMQIKAFNEYRKLQSL